MPDAARSPRMFSSDRLDALTRAEWWTVPLIWVPGSAGIFLYGTLSYALDPTRAFGVAVMGWLAWTLAEYTLHRSVFHWVPRARWGPKLNFVMHGAHHGYPRDRLRWVMPPSVSLTLGVVVGLAFFAWFTALSATAWFWPFYGGFTFGYMAYDLTHYAVHQLKWSHPAFQVLKRHHLLHHHSPEHAERRYGVTTTLWDHVFGTW